MSVFRKKNIWIAGILLSLGMVNLSACGKQQKETADRIYVGVTIYNQSDIFLSQLIICMQEQFEQLEEEGIDVTVTVRDAAGSQHTQDDQVQEFIDAGCNVLCVNLVDRTDPSEIIELARKNQVPIIFFNREPVAEDMMQWDGLYYVGADAKQSGVMQGELAVDAIQGNPRIDRNKDGKIQYVVLEGEAGHQDVILRTENAVDTIRNHGIELEKLSYGIANWNRSQAQNRMLQMISEHQNKIELVLANNDDMALGAMDAYQKLNFTEADLPVFFGIDGTDVGLQAVADSRLSGTVYNDKEGQGRMIARLATAITLNQGWKDIRFKRGQYIYLPYSKITTENVGDFVIDS